MIEFVRQALQERFDVIVKQIRAAGFEVFRVDNGDVVLEPIGSVIKQLPAPIAAEAVPKIPGRDARSTGSTERVCDEPGCGGKHLSRGKCSKHYARMLYHEKKKAKKA